MTPAIRRRALPLVAIPPIRCGGKVRPIDRRAPEGPRFTIIDNQAEIVPQVIAERARREAALIPDEIRFAAYAADERSPWAWENRFA